MYLIESNCVELKRVIGENHKSAKGEAEGNDIHHFDTLDLKDAH